METKNIVNDTRRLRQLERWLSRQISRTLRVAGEALDKKTTNILFSFGTLRRLRWVASTDVAFAAVSWDTRTFQYTFLVNPTWLNDPDTPWDEVYATVIHEALHIIKGDIPAFLRLTRNQEEARRRVIGRLSEIADDMANNQDILELFPLGEDDELGYWVLPEQYGYRRERSRVYYLHCLLDEWDENVEKAYQELSGDASCFSQPGPSGEGSSSSEKNNDAQSGDEQGDTQGGGGSNDAQSGDEQGGPGDGGGSNDAQSGDEQGDTQSGGGGGGSNDAQSGDEQGDTQSGGGGSNDAQSGDEQGGPGDGGGEQMPLPYAKEAASSVGQKYGLTKNQESVLAAALSANIHHPWEGGDSSGGSEAADAGEAVPGREISSSDISALIEMLESQTKQLKQSVAQEHAKFIGNLPAHLKSDFQEALNKLNTKPAVPWTHVFTNLVASARSLHVRRSMRWAKKRLYRTHMQDEDGELFELPEIELIYPGQKVDRDFVVLYAIDTSGSMSNLEILKGLKELEYMRDNRPGTHIIVAQCDTHISDVTYLEKMSAQEYIDTVGRTSGGGTQFVEPFKLANAFRSKVLDGPEAPLLRSGVRADVVPLLGKFKRADVVVYVTDGYGTAAPRSIVQDTPVIWVITTPSKTGPNFPDARPYGRIVHTD